MKHHETSPGPYLFHYVRSCVRSLWICSIVTSNPILLQATCGLQIFQIGSKIVYIFSISFPLFAFIRRYKIMQHHEKYTLTWKDYSDHLREALKEMMTSTEFADVTLVTDDKQQSRSGLIGTFSVLPVQFSRVFSILTATIQIQLFTSEGFSILKWSQSCSLSIWERQDFMKKGWVNFSQFPRI